MTASQIEVGPSHFAFLLSDGRLCRLPFSVISDRLDLNKTSQSSGSGGSGGGGGGSGGGTLGSGHGSSKGSGSKSSSHASLSTGITPFFLVFCNNTSFEVQNLKPQCIFTISHLVRSRNYGRPMKPFFYQNPKLLGFGKQIGQINSGAFGVFFAELSAPILVQ